MQQMLDEFTSTVLSSRSLSVVDCVGPRQRFCYDCNANVVFIPSFVLFCSLLDSFHSKRWNGSHTKKREIPANCDSFCSLGVLACTIYEIELSADCSRPGNPKFLSSPRKVRQSGPHSFDENPAAPRALPLKETSWTEGAH